MKRVPTLALCALFAATLTSCSDLTQAPPTLLRASGPPSRALFDALVLTATRSRPLRVVQPNRGRFAVVAQYRDRFGAYVFAVECFRDGSVWIRPAGPRVERVQGDWMMPIRLREEMRDLEEELRHILQD